MYTRQISPNARDQYLTEYGHFVGETVFFVIESLNLPAGWDYVYQNRRILRRVDVLI